MAIGIGRASLSEPSRLVAMSGAVGQSSETHDDTVVSVSGEADLSVARTFARDACNLLGIRGYVAQRVVTAVSELTRNITRYAGSGRIRFRIDPEHDRLSIVAEDQGPGIANLDEILAGRYVSKTGLGRGLFGVRKLADEFDIQTSEHGTRVALVFRYGGR